MPESFILEFAAPIDIQGSTPPDKPARFSMLAYSGGPMTVEGWRNPVVVDLAGLEIPSQNVPIRLNHDPNQGVGHTDSITATGGRLAAAGVISRDTQAARDVLGSSRRGFPWQASIGAQARADSQEFVSAGHTAEANGRMHAGPVVVVRKARLNEISFVDSGADPSTSAVAASKERTTMPPDISTTATPPPAAPPTPDPVLAERERIQAEGRRVQEIVEATEGRDDDIRGRAIRDGWSLERLKSSMFDLDRLRASRNALDPRVFAPSRGQQHDIAAPGGPDALTAAAMLLGGHGQVLAKLPGGEMLANSVRAPRSWSDLAAMALQQAGQPVPHDRDQLLKAAFSTVSLPTAVGSSVQKTALAIFAEETSDIVSVCRVVSARDFKAGKAIRLSPVAKLLPVGATGEIKHGDLNEDAYDYQIATYARMFGISRQDLINDDASILSDLPLVLANEASRTLADLFTDAITGGVGASFFTTGRGNYLTGTTSALTVNALSAAVAALRTMTDRDDRVIGLRPFALQAPAALESTARQVLTSTTVQRDTSKDNSPTASPFAGLDLRLVINPRLDADSTKAWYLHATPMHGSVLLAALDGQLGARVESQDMPFHTLGHEWRAYMDIGIKLGEYKAVIRNKGEA